MSTTHDPKPRRKRRPWLILLPVVLLALVGLAMAVPGSPIYLPTLLEPEVSVEGRTRSQWVGELSSTDKKQRSDAAAALGKMNTGGKKALPDLLKVMQTDPDGEVRASAADAASKMFPAQEPEAAQATYSNTVIGPFTAGLSDAEKRVRYTSAVGLLKLKDKARPAVPALRAGADNPENDTNLNIYHATIRQVMLKALGEAAAGTPDAVPTFMTILDEKLERPKKLGGGGGRGGGGGPVNKEEMEAAKKYAEALIHRRIAVTGLGLAGEHGKPAAAKIRELANSEIDDDKIVAKEALERMGEPLDKK